MEMWVPEFPISQDSNINKISYDKDSDILYVGLEGNDSVPDFVIDFDEEGYVKGIEILYAKDVVEKLKKAMENG